MFVDRALELTLTEGQVCDLASVVGQVCDLPLIYGNSQIWQVTDLPYSPTVLRSPDFEIGSNNPRAPDRMKINLPAARDRPRKASIKFRLSNLYFVLF